MPERRYVTTALSVGTGGTATQPVVAGTDLTSYDDRKVRHVRGILATGGAAGVRLNLVDAGGLRASIDTSMFSTAHGPLRLETDFEVGDLIHVDLSSTIAGATNGVQITIAYEVD
jgi:hypothetical protein